MRFPLFLTTPVRSQSMANYIKESAYLNLSLSKAILTRPFGVTTDPV